MIRHTQQIIGDPARGDGHDTAGRPGDCWKTCIASIMDLPQEKVPHFAALGEDMWWYATQEFIKQHLGQDKELRWWTSTDQIPDGPEYLIASGPSPRGDFQHAVVADRTGQTIHDPHPSRAGLAGPATEYFAIVARER